jgi:vacuolar iron transporter family protein
MLPNGGGSLLTMPLLLRFACNSRPLKPMSFGAENLETQHTPAAIAARLDGAHAHSYLGDFVLGAIDGTVTTFAVVAGAAGAQLSQSVAIILGVANLLADGFSMAASNYLGTQADEQVVDRLRQIESRHIDEVPEGEREEIRQIFAAKGFEGELLESAVQVITQDRKRWIDTMLTDEFGVQTEKVSAARAALATFVAFVAAGLVPLLPYFVPMQMNRTQVFATSAAATAITFFLVGVAKGRVVQRSLLRSGCETLAVGGVAAALAYAAGVLLHTLIGG